MILLPQPTDTQSELAAQRVESDIVTGILAPGARLGITETAARYQVGATPLREALSRLAARGLVDANGMKGFRVKGISRADLADIIVIRSAIEREALIRSLAHGGSDWEVEIVASLHRLKHIVRTNPRGHREGNPEFDRLHKAFHASLIAACASPRLLAAQSDLYDQAYRYRRLMMSKYEDTEGFLAEHDGLAELVLSRDAERASAKLSAHIASTLRHVFPDAGNAEA